MLNGNAQKHVGTALVELAGEPIAGDVELKQQVAGRQSHLLDIRHVPGRDDQPPRLGIGANLVFDPGDLVDRAAVGARPRSPLVTVNRTEITVFVGPLVPDRDAVVLQPADVGVASQKPQQFVDDRPDVDSLGRQQREALGEIKSHLATEQPAGPHAGAVVAIESVMQHFVEKLQISTHQPHTERERDRLGQRCLTARRLIKARA